VDGGWYGIAAIAASPALLLKIGGSQSLREIQIRKKAIEGTRK
jgi:hypothetical protein